MKIKILVVFTVFTLNSVYSQSFKLKNDQSGIFSLGGRSTLSMFNDIKSSSKGTGLGGQFRLQFAEKVNSDWFFDYLTSDIGNLISRTDYHIGWSVLVYPIKQISIIKPYLIAGHCFDYSYYIENSNPYNYTQRWSSAVQGGLGSHFFLTDRLDASITAQYMMHLGNHVEPEINGNTVLFNSEKGASLEGHLLMTLSLNYKICDLW